MAATSASGLIDLEIKKILETQNQYTNDFVYDLVIHTEKENINISMLYSIEWLKDFNSNLTDYIIATFDVLGGTYIKKIYQNRDNLEATITKKHKNNKVPPLSVRYKLVFLTNTSGVEGSQYSKMTEEELNQTYKFRCEAQLIERNFEGLRAVTFGTVLKNTTVGDAIGTIFKTIVGAMIKVNGQSIPLAIYKDKPNNDYVYKNLVIPQGMNLLDFPSWLQHEKGLGVYNGNIGTYYITYKDKPTIFIYPLYTTTDISTIPKLMIYHANTSKYEFVENTYKEENGLIKLLCGNNIKNQDDGSNGLISKGSAIISQDPNTIMNRNLEITDGKAKVDKKNIADGASITKRRDGVEKAIYVGSGSNLYATRSNLIKETLSFYQIPWKFCNFELLLPGMVTTFVYEDEKYGITKLNGVLQSGYAKYDKINGTTTGLINIMVQNPNVYFAEERAKKDAKLKK